jgi:hypothetical protein
LVGCRAGPRWLLVAALFATTGCAAAGSAARRYPDIAEQTGARIDDVRFEQTAPFPPDTLLTLTVTQPSRCNFLGLPICVPFTRIGREEHASTWVGGGGRGDAGALLPHRRLFRHAVTPSRDAGRQRRRCDVHDPAWRSHLPGRAGGRRAPRGSWTRIRSRHAAAAARATSSTSVNTSSRRSGSRGAAASRARLCGGVPQLHGGHRRQPGGSGDRHRAGSGGDGGLDHHHGRTEPESQATLRQLEFRRVTSCAARSCWRASATCTAGARVAGVRDDRAGQSAGQRRRTR